MASNGYGMLHHNGNIYAAHRLSLGLTGIELGELWALHHCDNRKCVNPDHLYAGTVVDNVHDAVERGRLPTGADHPSARRKAVNMGGQHNGR